MFTKRCLPPITYNATYHSVGADIIRPPITHRLPHNTVGNDVLVVPLRAVGDAGPYNAQRNILPRRGG